MRHLISMMVSSSFWIYKSEVSSEIYSCKQTLWFQMRADAMHWPKITSLLMESLTPWFMEPGGSRLLSQGLSNNPYPEPYQQFLVLIFISLRSILILSSHLRIGLPKGFFPIGLPVKILKALLLSSNLATRPARFNLLDLIILTILGERYKPWSSSLWSLIY